MNSFGKRLTLIFILATAYFVGGKLGLTLAFVHPVATAVWPCSGIALGALLLFGEELWPGIALGAFLVNLTTTGTISTSISTALGNTLEGVAAAFLVTKYARGRDAMNDVSSIFKFALLGAMFSATIAATVGVLSLKWGGLALPNHLAPIWWTWWLGDAVGIVLVTPLLLLWNSVSYQKWRTESLVEATALFICLVAVGLVVFDGILKSGARNYPLEYLCVPFLIWAAARFGKREAVIATLVLSAMAIWGTLHGFGPFARETKHESLLLLQAFLGVGAVMTLVLASQVSEQRRAEREARNLAVIDQLTGLGNYRKLIDTLETEIRRSERMKRSFVFVLMDVDGLKQINDVYGHPAGNRALCRLANVLQVHCRSIDTPARYGGDEFALVLPECSLEFAHTVVDRIRDRLAADNESPALAFSVGFAVWQQSGSTDSLFREADRALYEMKHRHHGHRPLPS